MIFKIFFLLLFISIVIIGCGSDDKGNSNSKPFYNSAVDTTPVIKATSRTTKNNTQLASRAFNDGIVPYEIFNSLREYIHSRDKGKIGLSNIYKLLYQAGSFYNNFASNPAELPSVTAIASPFDFGTVAETYTHARNDSSSNNHGYATKQVNNTVYALLSWTSIYNSGTEYGVMEGNYNEDTGAVAINMVCYVDYASMDYCLRTELIGNSIDHTFTLKIVKYNPGGYAISMIGTGISESSDPNDYFLFKVSDNSGVTDRYYKFSSSANENDFKTYAKDGYANVTDAGGDPDGYDTILGGMTPFALDGSDNATSVNDFTNSSILLDF